MELTPEQKLMIREKQVQILATRNTAHDLLDRARAGEMELQQTVTKMATDLKIDQTKFGFNMDTLEFTPLNGAGKKS